KSHRPIRNPEEREYLGRNLDKQPADNRVRDRNLVNVAPLQFGEEIVDLHFGFSSQSFWKRGSLRSGSNIGSSRSRAGVSEPGIESSFCNPAMARSGSPMPAATRARVSIGPGPSTASFSIGFAAMPRSARANAAALSPRSMLISARSSSRLEFSGCSLRKDASSL